MKDRIIIIGNGIAWYLLAYNLIKKWYENIILVGKNQVTNSILSGWEILTRWFEWKSMKRILLENWEFLNNRVLLEMFLDNFDTSITNISRFFPIQPSFIWWKTSIWKMILDLQKK